MAPIPVRRVALWLILAASGPPAAYPQTWSSVGPPGGWVEALVVDPVTPTALWVGTDGGGVFRSTDSGSTWFPVSSGLEDLAVRVVAVDPSDPRIVYVGTGQTGVFKSTDRGSTWYPASNGMVGGSFLPVHALVLDPGLPSTLLAGSEGAAPMYRSTDSGGSLPEDRAERPKGFGYKPLVQRGGLHTCLLCLLLDWKTLQDVVLVVVVTDRGLFVTEDDGAHWNSVTDQLLTREIRGFAETLPRGGKSAASRSSRAHRAPSTPAFTARGCGRAPTAVPRGSRPTATAPPASSRSACRSRSLRTLPALERSGPD